MQFEPGIYRVEQLIAAGVLEVGDGYRAKNCELASSGLPFARAGNIDGGFRFAGADRIPSSALVKVGTKVSRPGDVVFTSKGTVGRFAFVTDSVEQFVYSPQLCYWRSLAPDVLDPRFLYYWMHGPEFVGQIDSLKGQTDMADYVSLRDQRRMRITLVPFATQLAVADILGSHDDRAAVLLQSNSTLESIAQALFKSWFIDFDPVRAKAEGREPEGIDASTAALFPDALQESTLGLIPKGWAVHPLDSIATYLNGLALQKFPAEDNSEFLPVIKIAQLRAGNTLGADRASARLKPEYIVRDGDILFSWSGSLEVEFWCGGDGALNQHLFKVSSERVPKWFCYLATRHFLPSFRQIAANKATTMGHIQRHHLTEAKLAVPPDSVLSRIGAIIGPLLERRITNSIQARELASVRDTLLPRLISGTLRLPDAELQIAEVLA